MKRFAVGHFSLHTNELHIEIVEAESIEFAPFKHSKFGQDYFNGMDHTWSESLLENMKLHAFNCDEGLDVVEII